MTEVEPVTDLVRRFAEEYLVDFKVASAARRANISVEHARHVMLDPRVQALIQEGKRRATMRAEISVDWVIEKLRRIAEASPVDYLHVETGLDGKSSRVVGLKLHDLTDEERDGLKSYKMTQNGPAIETHDKVAAVTKIGQFLGMFTDKVELTGPGGGPVNVTQRARTADEIKAELEALGLPTKMFDE